MTKKTRNTAGWFLLQLLLATLLSSCTFEDNIEEFRRRQRYATPVAGDFAVSGLSQIYDGSPKRVIVTPKPGKSGQPQAVAVTFLPLPFSFLPY